MIPILKKAYTKTCSGVYFGVEPWSGGESGVESWSANGLPRVKSHNVILYLIKAYVSDLSS